MRLLIILVQVVISALVTATVMPAVLATVPAARDQRVGIGVVAGLLAATYFLVTLIWPRRKT